MVCPRKALKAAIAHFKNGAFEMALKCFKAV